MGRMQTVFRRIIKNVFIFKHGSLQSVPLRTCKTTPKKQIHSYILRRYIDYVKKYEDVLETRFPGAVKLYRVFSIGVKEFKDDVVLLIQVFKKINAGGSQSLTRREMEIYNQMPKDMLRVAPVLLVSALPFGGVIFPVAYMFPQKLLTSHFWSLQQRSEFAIQEHKKKLTYYRPVFRHMQTQLRLMKTNPLHKKWSNILGQLGSGIHPSPAFILQCKALFEGEPYHLRHLYSSHVSSLLKLHNMHRGWRRRKRLAERALLIHQLDLAILQEGDLNDMSHDDLKRACFFRGLNPTNMRHEDILDWLTQWLQISKNIDHGSLSLLLHCPILLAYNQPSNWALLCDTRIRI